MSGVPSNFHNRRNYTWAISIDHRPGAPLEHLEHLDESPTELHTKCMRIHPNAIIAGDFNVGDIAWDTDAAMF